MIGGFFAVPRSACSRQPSWSAHSFTVGSRSELEALERNPRTGTLSDRADAQEVGVSIRLKIEDSSKGLVATSPSVMTPAR